MKIGFEAVLEKFAAKGEKTGWTYITVPIRVSEKLKPGCKKSYRVKGLIDEHSIQFVALIPMGEGQFILPVNAVMRKAIKKNKGANVSLKLEVDDGAIPLSEAFLDCLKDEPNALANFNKLAASHQQYFCNWIQSAKSETTKINRIAAAVNGLVKNWDYGTMIREQKKISIH